MPTQPSRLPRVSAAHKRALRNQIRAECENWPGTYCVRSANGTVIYIGQSCKLRTRLLSYFRARGRRAKSARILRYAHSITWSYEPTEFAARISELRLIKQLRPEFNRVYAIDDWPRCYVAITRGNVPGLRVVPTSDHPQAEFLYGPFRRVSALRDAVKVLADLTGVRDCTIDDMTLLRPRRLWFEAQNDVRTRAVAQKRTPGCLRVDVGTCAGPCIGGGDPAAYRSAVEQARRFLEGEERAPLRQLKQAMIEASEQLHFERAAVLRDRLANLTWLHKRLRQFRANVDRLTFRYHVHGTDGQEYVYFIRRGTVRAIATAPRTLDEQVAFDALTRRVLVEGASQDARLRLHDVDEFHLVSSWFRQRPDEFARTIALTTA